MFDFLKSGERPALFLSTVKAVAATAASPNLAASWLSAEVTDRQGVSRLAGNAAGRINDPATTGSVPPITNPGRLDPCTGQRRP